MPPPTYAKTEKEGIQIKEEDRIKVHGEMGFLALQQEVLQLEKRQDYQRSPPDVKEVLTLERRFDYHPPARVPRSSHAPGETIFLERRSDFPSSHFSAERP